ncbi:sensor histidine kinase [Burkholderia sp. PAMC 26561]|uniref:sensor histidine kinase n=1 Tax=Burkholderia sp. PAMC 26561 TaxID=1795043 RepID=UPI00076AF3C3|nr:sensor histidine kinase [Burkholderia sp. PAMC 26561]AME27302.1 histidine kinase [Burkholderia sp. PAMC 26561]AME27547.1 histidine kinase [Burkholderia sp. PAMC 26561]
MTETQAGPLRGFAEFLRRERTTLTEKWMKAVFGDASLVEADKLTYDQLADHLPEILDGICAALDAQDLEQVEPAIERDARTHGKVRWQQGYRIDELVHELDLFRQVLVDAAETFAELDGVFTRRHEGRARRLIDEALGFVTVTSIREVVTERDRKIDEYTGSLERANHELALKQQLVSDLYESRMQITRSVVHDLRNFLNAFSTALQLISRAPSKAEAGLALATRQAADMKQLVDDMVVYSVVLGDRAPLAVEPFDLRELFDELVTACRPGIEAKGLHLSTCFDAAVPTVLSNRIKVKQVALNLLSNATKYTKAGEVKLAMGGHGDGGWFLRVADTGVGIASSDTNRIFDEFQRAAGEDIPGVGLGLAIVKELCRVLDGRIHFETRQGHGTTFEIRFPVRAEAPLDSQDVPGIV